MGKHIIPQYYLRGFASNHNEDHVYVSERFQREIKELPIKAIAQSKDYYTDDVERFLSEEIEAKANPIIRKLREGHDYTVEDKENLSKYFCIMVQRVDRHKERMDNLKPKVIESFFTNNKTAIQSMSREHPEKKVVLDKALETLERMHREFEEKMPSEIDAQVKEPIIRDAIVDHFMKMRWRIIYSFDQEYVTSDNPVFFFEGIGIGNDQSEVSVPISKNISVLMNNEIGKDLIKRKISNRIIREINRRTISFATRFIYSARNYHWLQNMVTVYSGENCHLFRFKPATKTLIQIPHTHSY